MLGLCHGPLWLRLRLRLRLRPAGVSVLTIKPGFVRTQMTASLPPSPIFAEPAAVAAKKKRRRLRRMRRVSTR